MGDIAGAGAVSKAVADVINHAADKIENACGWLATPKGASKDKLIAKETFIHDIQNNPNLTPLQKAAFISESKKIIRQYKNQNDIYHLAMEQLSEEAKPDKVDVDWISQFFDAAKHVSQEDLKVIWAKLLANECQLPGSVPKMLIHTLSCLDTRLAKAFNIVCNCSVALVTPSGVYDPDYKYPIAIIDWQKSDKFYKSLGLNYNDLSDLNSYGLIELNIADYRLTKKDFIVGYCDAFYKIENRSENKSEIKTGQVHLTNLGKSLFRVIKQEKVPNFITEIQKYFERNNTEINKLDIQY